MDTRKQIEEILLNDYGCFDDFTVDKLLDLFAVSGSLPISKVVFFELKKGKYLASNGVEVTTEFILKHEHAIFHDIGYVIVERQ
jgi:hypothetical protein